MSAGAPGFEDTTRLLDPALRGGGVDVGVPRVSGATFRDSLRGGYAVRDAARCPRQRKGVAG